ncbi:MAG: hypothetical protein J4203_06345 [Candidatus Diapherotrites archaeon]|uniref:Uncharacterized protein n=1 Tax=Candidatus Iainarchaeum sp. TaxID=3101447 RepID=A0A8T4L974_9ARCH|nr:hypothetical protein [Candidatus Diapherotrites archaeon]
MELKVVAVLAVVLVALIALGFFNLLPGLSKKTVQECEDQPGSLLKDVCYSLKARNEKNADWCNSVYSEAAKKKCLAQFKSTTPGSVASPSTGTEGQQPASGETPVPAGGSKPEAKPVPKTLAEAKVIDLMPAKAEYGSDYSVERDEEFGSGETGYAEGRLLALKKAEESGGSTAIEVKVIRFQSKSNAKDYFSKEKGTMKTDETTKAFDEGLGSTCFSIKFEGGVIQKTARVLCRRDEIAFTVFVENKDTSKSPDGYVKLFGQAIEARLDQAVK